jgi:hypothetical protein
LVTGKLSLRASSVSFSAASEKNHATTGVDDRTLGFLQNLHSLLDLPEMPLDHRVVGTHLHRLRIIEFAHLGSDVLGHIDHNRARTAGAAIWKAFLIVDRQVLDILDQEIVLDAGAGNTDRIALLEGILTDVLGRHLAGNAPPSGWNPCRR